MDKIKLSANHRRSLSANMHIIEKLADEFEQELHSANDLKLFKMVQDVPDAKLEAFRAIIKEIKEYVAFMADKYSLEPKELYQSRVINARTSKMWEILCNAKSKRMQGYGKFPEKFAAEYDTDIDGLLEIVSKIN